jgi:hypothetical protein
MPAYSDELAYRVGLLDTQVPNGEVLTLKEMRKKYLINERARNAGEGMEFSINIRK